MYILVVTILQDIKVVPVESLKEPVSLEEQTTHSETPTTAWPEQKKGSYLVQYNFMSMLLNCLLHKQ